MYQLQVHHWLPSTITPNKSVMHPVGKLPVSVLLQSKTYSEEFHIIYPDVDRILLSWRAAQELRYLNRYVRRERYQSDTPAQAVADIAAEHVKIFTKLDALKGYHQNDESQLLTTFIVYTIWEVQVP